MPRPRSRRPITRASSRGAERNPRRLDVRDCVRLPHGRVSGRLHACRHGVDVRRHRLRARSLQLRLPWRDHPAHLRHHDQRGSDRGAAVRVHGDHAAALAGRRRAPRQHGAHVRRAPGRPWDIGLGGRRADGRLDRHRRRHRGHDGSAGAADHAAAGLRSGARLRYDLRLGDARPDHPTLDRAGAAGRGDLLGVPTSAARPGPLLARGDFRGRSVRRRAPAGARAGRHVHSLSDRRRLAPPRKLAAGPYRRCRICRRGRPMARHRPRDGAADRAHRRGARIDPRRFGDADRGGPGRRRGLDLARGLSARQGATAADPRRRRLARRHAGAGRRRRSAHRS